MERIDFIRPTKVKIIGVVIIYIANVVESMLTSGFVLLLAPKVLMRNLDRITLAAKESVEFPLNITLAISTGSFLIKIILFYLTVCIIVRLIKKV